MVSREGVVFVYLMYFLHNILSSSLFDHVAQSSLGRAVVTGFASLLRERCAMIFCIHFVCNIIPFSCVSKDKQLLKKINKYLFCLLEDLRGSQTAFRLASLTLQEGHSFQPALCVFLISLNICWFLAFFLVMTFQKSHLDSSSDCTKGHTGKVVQQRCTK